MGRKYGVNRKNGEVRKKAKEKSREGKKGQGKTGRQKAGKGRKREK